MIIRIIGIVLAVVFAVGVCGTLVGVGIGVVRYMTAQNFNFREAVRWSWDEYTEWLQKVNPIKTGNAEVIEYPMTNQHVDVVGCPSL